MVRSDAQRRPRERQYTALSSTVWFSLEIFSLGSHTDGFSSTTACTLTLSLTNKHDGRIIYYETSTSSEKTATGTGPQRGCADRDQTYQIICDAFRRLFRSAGISLQRLFLWVISSSLSEYNRDRNSPSSVILEEVCFDETSVSSSVAKIPANPTWRGIRLLATNIGERGDGSPLTPRQQQRSIRPCNPPEAVAVVQTRTDPERILEGFAA
mmetsp:Transcript_6642/g.15889  ORF Transcript_6642/g.15889 Transcript_6642/m.15889 type:complete len:211 (-) Transcript_6642:3107-3739(-)